ncbi:hypothetical protein, partial [Rhodohalobacter sulfatireducens]
ASLYVPSPRRFGTRLEGRASGLRLRNLTPAGLNGIVTPGGGLMKSGALKRGSNPGMGRLSKTDTPRRWILKRQEVIRGVVRKIMNGFLIRLNRSWSFSLAFPSRSTTLKLR